jgi:hypothetical protein
MFGWLKIEPGPHGEAAANPHRFPGHRMIRKSLQRLCEKIMPNQRAQGAMTFRPNLIALFAR